MSRNKGVIFDLDGVIVDTAKFHFLAWRQLANNLGFDISEVQNEQLKGVSREKSLEKILEWGQVKLSGEKFQEHMSLKNENYLSYIATMTAKDILPGVDKVLNYLINRQVPIALGSASKNARSILEKTELSGKFNAIVDGNEVSRAKPNPEVFLIAASRLKTEPHNCIVFEDSKAGIQAANTADMVSIGIGDKEILGEADYIFRDFTEIDKDFINTLLVN